MKNDGYDDILEDARSRLQATGEYPTRLINNADLHDRERHNVFGKAWIYLGHVTEIPRVADYMLRNISEDQFIVLRDKEGEIRALHNSCRHRGMQLCRAEHGNASRFTCPYHGWTFSNTGRLVAMPGGESLYGSSFDKTEMGLRELPGLQVFHGMIFGTINPDAVPLKQYLGPMAWYLEMMVARTKEGLEVRGAPQRWVINADWKLAADNFVGDAYHTATTHASMLGGAMPRDAMFAMTGHQIIAGEGNGVGYGSAVTPDGGAVTQYVGMPKDMWQEFEETLSAEQGSLLKDCLFLHGNVFPNMAFLQVFEAPDEVRMPVGILTFRIWHPVGPGKMEVWSWFLVDKSAPDAYKQESYEAYLRTFGSGGGFEADDAENWRSITRMAKGVFSEGSNFNYKMGLNVVDPDRGWPGPGVAYSRAFLEATQRSFHLRWLDYMMGAV